ncbi:Asp-tRNA(Asn)/Glu-tRNA(Gln) amidotransferase subunit GatA [Brackiella oedipodis]|uniref:Asp-tRNA(Asn)/Glu-tRNA(Gln) amidotransferase subunit GatA n=1 Tax=Brackiella oedipodis TaxID=124225 RepID=UPI00048AB2E5|nr:Asp-tRNA(Asn)/Glu-tRNA(Gln) amidotransferase subunit GatA [Brackiella oedipodis]
MSVDFKLASLDDLRQALDHKQVSATELAQTALQEAQRLQDYNIFLDINESATLAQAQAADELISKGQQGRLTGIPIAHKDVFVTQQWRTTAASKMLETYQSPFDASVVESLKQAGMVTIGKVNCDEFAMGSGNQNSAFGACRNPWDKDAVPGGSSGGSAAAVAAHIVPFSTGTDTGGSVRQPASMCGISGIKPTYGTVSRFGMIAYGSSLDQAGIMGRRAADLSDILDVMSHFDERDSTSLQRCGAVANQSGRVRQAFEHAQQQMQAQGDKPLKGLRIGVPKEWFNPGLSAEVATAIEQAISQFQALGAERVDISLPKNHLAIPAYYVIAPAEASSNLARYDGVRYGHRSQHYKTLEEMTARSRHEAFGPEVQRRIMIGAYVLSQGYYDAYYLQAQRVRRMIAEEFKQTFTQHCDVIMGPVAPEVAPNIGANQQDITHDWLADIYTLSLNLAGLPGMSIPCGFGGPQQKRPIGLQIIGNYFTEGQLLAIADRFQQHSDWHLRSAEV